MVTVHIDCATCVVREVACHDCVISVVLGRAPDTSSESVMKLGRDEQAALEALAGSGLVPPLRHQEKPRASEASSVPTPTEHDPGRRFDPPPLRLIRGTHPARAVQPSFEWEDFG